MRDGLFSTDEFVAAARGFTLLRLKPGPAEARFGITAAPMAAVADGHGRVTVPSLDLRGDIGEVCARLRLVLAKFDRRAASRPPDQAPRWARPFLVDGGSRALAGFLVRVHPRSGRRTSARPGFSDLVKVYDRIETEGERIAFSMNLLEASKARVPRPGASFPGYEAESALLRKMTWCRNDSIKFKAIMVWAAFAPIAEIAFLAERAEKKNEDALNPNVVLCNCVNAVGVMARRFPGAADRRTAKDRDAILGVLPMLVKVLDEEGRNNGACRLAKGSLEVIVEATGAPEALEAYLHNLRAPKVDSDWMRTRTDKYHAAAAAWLEARTGQKFGVDEARWRRWYEANRERLYYHPKRKVFVVDAAAARRLRERLAVARRKN